MRRAWRDAGLRTRLALAIGLIVLVALAAVYAAVRRELADESAAIERGERVEREAGTRPASGSIAEIGDAQDEVVRALVLSGAAALVAALLAGYLLAARTAAPLRRLAATAAEVRAGELAPRVEVDEGAAVELRTVADSFNRMLNRLDEAFARQRRFASDASHELRTPITAIRGQIEVLGAGGAELARTRGIVLAELDRVEALVADLLELAALDEGRPLELADVALSELLAEVAGHAPARVAGTPPRGTLRCDRRRLRGALDNLLANARRHAGPDGIVEISAAADGCELTIAVDDDGPGIDPAERELVFERFHRSEAGRERTTGGSGLGLAIARSIVEAHGGRIRAGSSPLGGARVSLSLGGFRDQDGSA